MKEVAPKIFALNGHWYVRWPESAEGYAEGPYSTYADCAFRVRERGRPPHGHQFRTERKATTYLTMLPDMGRCACGALGPVNGGAWKRDEEMAAIGMDAWKWQP